MELTSLSQRLRNFIDFTEKKDLEFALSIEVSKQQLSDWLHGKKIPLAKISEILNKYPELNGHWLMTGDGNMLLSDKKEKTRECNDPGCNKIISELQTKNTELENECSTLRKKIIELQEYIIKKMDSK